MKLRCRPTTAMTMIEVLCMLLLIGLGLSAVIALVLWGLRLGNQAIGRHTAMATARSILYDGRPLLSNPADWQSVQAYDVTSPPAAAVLQTGFCNGYFVERREEAVAIPGAAAMVEATVRVRVFAGDSGEQLAAAQATILRARE